MEEFSDLTYVARKKLARRDKEELRKAKAGVQAKVEQPFRVLKNLLPLQDTLSRAGKTCTQLLALFTLPILVGRRNLC